MVRDGCADTFGKKDMDDPRIIAALISASVLLIIAIIKGVYKLKRDIASSAYVANSVMSDEQAKKFVEASRNYRNVFLVFNGKAVKLQKESSKKGMPLLQLCTDFFANHAMNYYEENEQFLEFKESKTRFQRILTKLRWKAINDESDSKRVDILRELGAEIICFAKDLNSNAKRY